MPSSRVAATKRGSLHETGARRGRGGDGVRAAGGARSARAARGAWGRTRRRPRDGLLSGEREARARRVRRPAAVPPGGRPAGAQHLGNARSSAGRPRRRRYFPRPAPFDARPGCAGQRTVDRRAAPARRNGDGPVHGRSPGRGALAARGRAGNAARPADWPLDYYQTAYATEAGSAEMPSAGRALTPRLITRLAARGIQLAPLILHTGVSSLEEDEPPYAERYRVPAETARMVNAVRAWGGRVIAVGTT